MTNYDIIATRKVPACDWNETARTAPKVKAKRNLWAYTFWIGGAVSIAPLVIAGAPFASLAVAFLSWVFVLLVAWCAVKAVKWTFSLIARCVVQASTGVRQYEPKNRNDE